MAIDEDHGRAVKTIENYMTRYYGKVRGEVASTSLVGSPTAIAERVNSFLSRGLDALIIGLADPDPKQLDLFGDKILPKLD
jgi:alkanesulfonate monooxygenase SsuD/methylene tetrahydromethanopterin reductase-like flavin-dependent oxidoreductase (luciferase family)